MDSGWHRSRSLALVVTSDTSGPTAPLTKRYPGETIFALSRCTGLLVAAGFFDPAILVALFLLSRSPLHVFPSSLTLASSPARYLLIRLGFGVGAKSAIAKSLPVHGQNDRSLLSPCMSIC